ncbi:SDR family NAD(P)-dependent oxidoreductase [Glaciimonas sp. GG7]
MSSSPIHPSSAAKTSTAAKVALIALVTDAASPLGCIIARALAAEGWDLALHYQGADISIAAQALVNECEATGRRALAICANLDDETETKALVSRVIAALGGLSCIVNNAAFVAEDSAADFSAMQIELHMRRNLTAPMLLTQALHAATPVGKQAVVINLLDQKLFSPEPDFLSYTLSKAALHSATQLLALAFAPRLRVVGIAPAFDLTQAAPDCTSPALSAATSADDLAASVCFIANSSAMTGTTLLMDNGQHLRARSWKSL